MIAVGNVFFARDRLLVTCLPIRLFVCFDFYFTSVEYRVMNVVGWFAVAWPLSFLTHTPHMLACFSALCCPCYTLASVMRFAVTTIIVWQRVVSAA